MSEEKPPNNDSSRPDTPAPTPNPSTAPPPPPTHTTVPIPPRPQSSAKQTMLPVRNRPTALSGFPQSSSPATPRAFGKPPGNRPFLYKSSSNLSQTSEASQPSRSASIQPVAQSVTQPVTQQQTNDSQSNADALDGDVVTRNYDDDTIWEMTSRYVQQLRTNTNPGWMPGPEHEISPKVLADWKKKKSRKLLNWEMGIHPLHPAQRKIAQQMRKEVSDVIFMTCNMIRLDEMRWKDYLFEHRTRMVRKVHAHFNPKCGWNRSFCEKVLIAINVDGMSNRHKLELKEAEIAAENLRIANAITAAANEADSKLLSEARKKTIINNTAKKDAAGVLARFTEHPTPITEEAAATALTPTPTSGTASHLTIPARPIPARPNFDAIPNEPAKRARSMTVTKGAAEKRHMKVSAIKVKVSNGSQVRLCRVGTHEDLILQLIVQEDSLQSFDPEFQTMRFFQESIPELFFDINAMSDNSDVVTLFDTMELSTNTDWCLELFDTEEMDGGAHHPDMQDDLAGSASDDETNDLASQHSDATIQEADEEETLSELPQQQQLSATADNVDPALACDDPLPITTEQSASVESIGIPQQTDDTMANIDPALIAPIAEEEQPVAPTTTTEEPLEQTQPEEPAKRGRGRPRGSRGRAKGGARGKGKKATDVAS
ncbi:hypothetical protein BJ508DRAFT_334015 [Ascobolus immersus RN42]|uniref:Uncharacterized protein n=1 Tax=Ascobolus immersus RN42 TaxID=1160509 RepID=A0A3N4HHJ5_ASCIM|nr:hypothetical protein BJ508DRAFT_334015 [Ascobolus immersus RN42]